MNNLLVIFSVIYMYLHVLFLSVLQSLFLSMLQSLCYLYVLLCVIFMHFCLSFLYVCGAQKASIRCLSLLIIFTYIFKTLYFCDIWCPTVCRLWLLSVCAYNVRSQRTMHLTKRYAYTGVRPCPLLTT